MENKIINQERKKERESRVGPKHRSSTNHKTSTYLFFLFFFFLIQKERKDLYLLSYKRLTHAFLRFSHKASLCFPLLLHFARNFSNSLQTQRKNKTQNKKQNNSRKENISLARSLSFVCCESRDLRWITWELTLLVSDSVFVSIGLCTDPWNIGPFGYFFDSLTNIRICVFDFFSLFFPLDLSNLLDFFLLSFFSFFVTCSVSSGNLSEILCNLLNLCIDSF